MSTVTDSEILIYVGCITHLGSTKNSTWQMSEIRPAVLTRPKEGYALQEIKCGHCGRTLTVNVESVEQRRIMALIVLVSGVVIGGAIELVVLFTGLYGLHCIGGPILLGGLWYGYGVFIKKTAPTDVAEFKGDGNGGHTLYDQPPPSGL